MRATTALMLVLLAPAALGGCSVDRPGDDPLSRGQRPAAVIEGADGAAGSSDRTGEAPSALASPFVQPSAVPSPTPERAVLVRVTEPGCCPVPFWSADGETVLFWNLPEGGDSAVYGVPVAGGPPRRVADRPSGIQLGGRFTTVRDGGDIELTRTDDGRVWRFATDGESLVVSADGTEVAWVDNLGDSVPGQAPPPRVHWRASLDGTDPKRVEVPSAYALADWTASGAWLLARTDRRRADLPALVRFDPDTLEAKPLFDGQRLRTFRVSPGRTWLAVTRAFEDDPSANALYVVATDGTTPPRRLDLVGGYQWRDDDRLVVVPLEMGAASMSLWQVVAASGEAERIGDPATTPFRIAAGEWSVAPGGDHMAFRSADDDAVWVMTLP